MTQRRTLTIGHTKQRGFTLIELLVVIAIIAILAAIIFPVFARVRQKGYQASCQSNLKQLAQAILMYADDHEGYGPLSHSSGCFQVVGASTNAPGGFCNSGLALSAYDCGWADYYVQSAGAAGSPMQVSDWKINPVWLCRGNGLGTYKMLYSRGGTWHSWEPQGGSYGPGSGGGRVRNTTRAGLIGDAWGYERMMGKNFVSTPGTPGAVYGYYYGFITPRDPNNIGQGADYSSVQYQRYLRDFTAHNGGNNMAFVDGHVKWMDAQGMLADMDWWVSAFQ
jgi:prepilin-type N-terminal cleavage/methylation domain-containing protein/prepilin-type processing-associated H-X9-DG protein